MGFPERTWAEYWRPGLVSGLCVSLLGFWSWHAHERDVRVAENGWSRMSYDVGFAFRPPVPTRDLMIVAMDEQSFRELNLGWDSLWPRSLHAQLLRKMTEDGARAVVFDVWFSDPGMETENQEFAKAVRDNGKVILAGIDSPMHLPGLAGKSALLPRNEFLTNAAGWGIAEMYKDPDAVSRRLYPGTPQDPSLAWATAEFLEVKLDNGHSRLMMDRWLNYYGPANHFEMISYAQALKQPPGFFADRIILVGAHRKTGQVGEENDEFRTPFTRWDGEFSSGVEIVATSIMNLVQGDWLTRLPPWLEGASVLLAGLVLGFGLGRWRPLPALGIAFLSMLIVCFIAALLVWKTQTWFSWMIILGLQVPAAWVGAVLIHFKRVKTESQFLRRTLDETISEIKRPSSVTPLSAVEGGIPRIPDHELLRRVGRGAYGEVWLARNTIGMHHAVKIVHRDSFSHDGPYEREFRGIQKYMPVSRSHPGLVSILHVGRNDPEGYFFYIMEAADDEVAGATIVPDTYRPRNLATVLGDSRVLSVETCVALMAALANALEALHRHKLVHRDIKPSNVIYLNGVPMFADIGLVTDLASRQNQVTMVGTRGYMPPEGPGMATADVFSLGKVLYQASTGMNPELFPELPTDFMDRPDYPDFKELNVIIGRACDSDPARRYQSAGEMYEALLKLQFQLRGRDASRS